MLKRKIIALASLALFAAMASSGVMAEENNPSKTCTLRRSKLDELQSVRNNDSIDYAQSLKVELGVRKEILNEVVDCSIQEASASLSNLNKVIATDPEVNYLKSQFSSRLEDALNYYASQKHRVGNLGLAGSRDFAKSLLDWREGNYKPTAKLASVFVIWAQNQDFIKAAQSRVNQVDVTINILRLTYEEDIQKLFKDVDQNMRAAKSANQKAKLDLRTYSPEEAMSSIKLSLVHLSQTYKNLFDLFAQVNPATPKK